MQLQSNVSCMGTKHPVKYSNVYSFQNCKEGGRELTVGNTVCRFTVDIAIETEGVWGFSLENIT